MLFTSVQPEVWDLTLYAGDRWPAIAFEVQDESGALRSDYTPKAQVKASRSDADAKKEFTLGAGFTKAGAKTTMGGTVDLPPGRYVWDVELSFSSGQKVTIYQGVIIVTRDVTK